MNIRRHIVAGALLLFLSACTMPQNYTVLPSSARLADIDATWKRWKPTQGDIAMAYERIPACLSVRELDLKDYHLQFAGVINGKGEKELWVNAFQNNVAGDFPKWKDETVVVDDGGDSFFDVMVNVDLKECHDLYVHGEA